MFVKETRHVLITWSAGLTKLTTFFQGFGSLVSPRFQKDGGAKSKQIWTNLSHWNTGGSRYRCEWGVIIFFFNLYVNVQLVKRDKVTAVIYCYITTEFHYAKRNSAYGRVCLVPRPQYYASVVRFGSRGPGRKVWPRQKSEK